MEINGNAHWTYWQPHFRRMQTHQWIYQKEPDTLVGPEHFERRVSALAQNLQPAHVRIAARFISVDPYMRINQAKTDTWMPPHPVGVVQSGAAIAQVIASASANFAAGDWVQCYSGWQSHADLHESSVSKIDVSELAPEIYLNALGMPGRTAWFGLTEIGQPRTGDTVVVSGAAGAVGSLVVQLAKAHGCRVLAIAGSHEKLQWLEELGADAVLNYRDFADTASLQTAIAKCIGGVDVYFDNVGGWISDAVWPLIKKRARIVICGQISQYSGGLDAPELGPRLLHHLLYQRATVQGVLARDFAHRIDEQHAALLPLIRSGRLISQQHIVDGFDALPSALEMLFTRAEHSIKGKVVVRI